MKIDDDNTMEHPIMEDDKVGVCLTSVTINSFDEPELETEHKDSASIPIHTPDVGNAETKKLMMAEEVNEVTLHSSFIPFGDIKDVKTPLNQAIQKHCSFRFITFLEHEDASTTMDNMDRTELYGRVLTENYALPEKIMGKEQRWLCNRFGQMQIHSF